MSKINWSKAFLNPQDPGYDENFSADKLEREQDAWSEDKYQENRDSL